MKIKELKEWLNDNKIPDNAEIAFWGYGDGAFYECTDYVVYDKEKNQVNIGY